MVDGKLSVMNFVNDGKLEVETYFLVLFFSAGCLFVLCHSVAKNVEFLVNLF